MNSPEQTQFVNSKQGLLLQVILVLIPPVLFLKNVYLLLGLSLSLLMAWTMLRLRGRKWRDVGLKQPEHFGRLVLVSLIATAMLLPLSSLAIHIVEVLTESTPNLKAFEQIRGNIVALTGGLVVAWIFGAFVEELLLRGFLLNTLQELLSYKSCPQWLTWTVAVLGTSIIAGMGHSYQGRVGMIGTGLIAVGFSAVYLMNRRNLWSCILAHGLYDTVAFILVYRDIALH